MDRFGLSSRSQNLSGSVEFGCIDAIVFSLESACHGVPCPPARLYRLVSYSICIANHWDGRAQQWTDKAATAHFFNRAHHTLTAITVPYSGVRTSAHIPIKNID